MEAQKVSRLDNLEVIYQEFVEGNKAIKASALKEVYISSIRRMVHWVMLQN